MDTKQAAQDEPLASEATQKRSGCQHHWVIDPPRRRDPSPMVCAGTAEKSATSKLPRGRRAAGAPRVEILVGQIRSGDFRQLATWHRPTGSQGWLYSWPATMPASRPGLHVLWTEGSALGYPRPSVSLTSPVSQHGRPGLTGQSVRGTAASPMRRSSPPSALCCSTLVSQ